MPTITLKKQMKTIEVPQGANLRKELMKAHVDVYAGIHKLLHCPGFGMCTSCRVHVTKGAENVSRQGTWEKGNIKANPIAFFANIGHEGELRLACQSTVEGDIEVETTPAMNWHGEKFWG